MKCPECQHENPPDTFYCGKCGAEIQGSEEKISFTRTLEIPAKELSRGTVFADRYEILEDLGEGGMGRVFRVHDRKLEEEVVLKLVRPEIASDRRMIERFKNEIKTARQVTHKNVCRMHDLNEAEDVAKALKATVDGWLNDKLMRYYFLLQGAIEQAKGNLPNAIRYLEKAEELEHFEWNIGRIPLRHLTSEAPRLQLSGRGPDHRPSQDSVRGREAAALPCLPAGRLDGGRGAGGLFLRTNGFDGGTKAYRL